MAFASAGVFAGTARAQATTPRAYAPLVVKNVGVNNTGIQVQNISGTPATVQVVYYDQLGRNLPFWNETQTVGVNASVTFYQGANPNLPQGFDGSAVINASQNVRAIINHADYSRGKASSGSFAAPVSGTAQVFLPAVFGGFNSYFTTINCRTREPLVRRTPCRSTRREGRRRLPPSHESSNHSPRTDFVSQARLECPT